MNLNKRIKKAAKAHAQTTLNPSVAVPAFEKGANWMKSTVIDEQDRLIGELTRRVARLEESKQKRTEWIRKAKEDAGYDQNTSFDDIWRGMLHDAKYK